MLGVHLRDAQRQQELLQNFPGMDLQELRHLRRALHWLNIRLWESCRHYGNNRAKLP